MSYLNSLRLAFRGTFQSDVSTINNDVRHFDNSIFKQSYQEYGVGASNGWWNPCGSGAFRLTVQKMVTIQADASGKHAAPPFQYVTINV